MEIPKTKEIAFYMRTPISISFCISDNYAQHFAVVIASILINNPVEDFVFHVVHHSVTPETEAKVCELESMYPRHRIVFHRIDERLFEKFPIPSTLAHITREMYYRYILPELLIDEERTIYSDVDVLCVKGGIRELFEMDLQGCPLAAILDETNGAKRIRLGLSEGKYFCSGLLVMNLAMLRAERSVHKLFETTNVNANRLVFPDQDVINIVFDQRIVEVFPKWNCADRYSFFRKDVIQWHFQCQTQKPWCNLWKNITWIPYFNYLLKTPYRSRALSFLFGHLKGFFYFSYTKNQSKRYLVCGIRVWKRTRM